MSSIEIVELPADAKDRLERRASPFAGALIGCITALLAGGLGWMAWAEVEEVVQAQGRVEPVGRVRIINHASGGRIARLHVEDGMHVRAGDPLLTFAPERAQSEQREILTLLELEEAQVARLEAEIEGREVTFPVGLAEARPDLLEQQRSLAKARAESIDSRRRALREAVVAARGSDLEVRADRGRIEGNLALLRQQLEAVRALTERGLYPKLKMLEIERQVTDHEGQLAKLGASAGGAEASVAAREADVARLDKEWREELEADLVEARTERDRLRQRMSASEAVLEELIISAPIDGIVQDLGTLAEGRSVAATEALMKLVPLGEGIVVRASVANEDIGRIKTGMPATVKVRAFDFARYGSLDGSVERVAADATPTSPDTAPAYDVTVLMAKTHMGDADDDAVIPGMLVDVELKVGERSILSYLTDGIVRHGRTALTES